MCKGVPGTGDHSGEQLDMTSILMRRQSETCIKSVIITSIITVMEKHGASLGACKGKV